MNKNKEKSLKRKDESRRLVKVQRKTNGIQAKLDEILERLTILENKGNN